MLLAVHISSYGCTWEVWRALKKLELLSAIASSNTYAFFVLSKLLACMSSSRSAELSLVVDLHILIWIYSILMKCLRAY